MYLINVLVVLLQALLVSAVPGLQQEPPHPTSLSNHTAGYGNHTRYTTTIYNSTVTVSITRTSLTILPSSVSASLSSSVTNSTTTSATALPTGRPTLPFAAIAVRSGSPIHLLPINAAGQRFWLGGQPSTYCPSSVAEFSACPPGDVTAFGLCAMGVIVPGGQEIFATPDGELGFTQAHSAFLPPGSGTCPFTYTELSSEEQLGQLGANATNAFGAQGLQACPTYDGRWQVVLNLANVTVPGIIAGECLEFSALTVGYSQGYAAWQYV